MHNLFILTLLSFLLASITTTAFEDKIKKNNLNIKYKLNANFDDLVLNYCTTYDSYTVNRVFSQKKIINNNINKKLINSTEVVIRKKPFNPSLIKLISNEPDFKFINKNIDEINLVTLSESKKNFVKTLLPLISYENQNILYERSRLEAIKIFLDDNKTLTKTDLIFLDKISKKYRLKSSGKHKYDIIKQLLNLVDIIPNSIVLAQAANESGWGTSRFAKEYNALFGEYTYDYSNGVIPLLRKDGEKFLVKTFESVNKSIQSYFNNLNSHYAYDDFREVRKIMRENNNFNDIKLLVSKLDAYAADVNYTKTINLIIDINKLDQFDIYAYSLNNS